MTYIATDASIEDGNPIELYQFNQGGMSYYYTSAAYTITYLTNDYVPEPGLKRSGINQSDKFEKNNISINFSRENVFASKFLQYTPDNPTTLTIFRAHESDGNYIAYWKGRVAGVSADNSDVKLECESVFTSLKRFGLRAKHQRNCGHVLYDAQCGLNKDDFKIPSVVSGLSGTTFTYAAVTDTTNPHLDAYYSGNLTGSVLTDDSGNSQTGTATDVTLVPSFVGNGLAFNGTTSKVVTPIVLPSAADFAISFSISSIDTDGAIISNDSSQAGGLQIKLTTGNLVQVLFETMTLVSTTTVSDAANTRVYLEHDDSTDTWNLYINGLLEDTGTESTVVDGAVVWIGANPDSSSFLDGTADQIRFFNKLQTADAITFLSTEDTNPTVSSDWFLAGMIQDVTGAYRFVTSHSGTSVTFSYPFESLADGDSVNLYAGCQHRAQTDCFTKFNNLDNYGGDSYRPTDDGPFTGRSIV